MTDLVNTIPDGYHSVTPYLFIDGAAEAIEFYKKILGATEVMRMPGPGGKIGHAEL
jgi:PhnB protein